MTVQARLNIEYEPIQVKAKKNKHKLKKHPKISGVLIKDDKYLFPVSWLHSQSYCELQLWWGKFLKIKLPPTREMLEGSMVHSRLEEEHRRLEVLKLSVPEAFELSTKEKLTLSFRELNVVGETGLYGIIDELVVTPNQVKVVDDKPGTRPWPSNIMQTRGYCLAFDEEYAHERTTVAQLRNRETKEVFWQEDFGLAPRRDIMGVVEGIQSLIRGEREFTPADNPIKCAKCRYNIVCDKSII